MRPALRISPDLDTKRPAAGMCVQAMFEKQAECAPTRVAVVFEEQQVTYGELNARANQLAHHLLQLGVGAEVAVGLCLDRSVELIVGVLGILKAGAAYVPLDASQPPARRRMILEAAGARVLVSSSELAKDLHASVKNMVCLDAEAELLAQASTDNVSSAVAAENLVYVIFTSGSTGRPKGVAVEHRQLVNYIDAIWEELALPAGSSFASVSTIAADLGNTAVFPALCKGGTLHLIAEERTTDPEGLAAYCQRHPIDCLKIVPTHLSALLAASEAADLLPRRRLVLGGEACPWNLVEKIATLAPACVVLNHYGPTEATVGAITNHVRAEDGERISETVPLGRPLANMQAYILDQQLRPVRRGVPGELYVGGAGLARGYINHADSTAEKFIPSPFSNAGERLYKTGDRARYLGDGRIEFLGRVDHQLKIRGYRIEPGEIEAVVRQHPSVRETVIQAREDEPGDMRLVAYVVPNLDAGLELIATPQRLSQIAGSLVLDLRRLLDEKLPRYMMPSAFVLLNALPLTPNGKLDRNSLPQPARLDTELESDVPPQTSTEEILASIWARVLKLKQVGVNNDFFQLGGHSLMAVRLFAEIEKMFGIRLPLATLFEAPTISQLAKILEGDCPSGSSLVPIQRHGTKPPLFCVHACGAHVFIYLPLVAHLDRDQPVYGLQAQGIDGIQEPFTRIEDMAAHYIKEIREVDSEGPYYLVGDTLGGLIAFEIAQQLTSQGKEVGLLAMFDTACPLPLSFGPRAVSHLRHLKEFGAKHYVLSAGGAVARKLGLRFPHVSAPVGLNAAEQEFADDVSASNDAVQRTEWGIYLATHVNYRPPGKRLPGRITYFRARDNRYGRGEDDYRLNWKRGADEFEVYDIPGRHDTIREEPFVAGLADRFVSSLQRAQQRDPRFQKQGSSISTKVSA